MQRIRDGRVYSRNSALTHIEPLSISDSILYKSFWSAWPKTVGSKIVFCSNEEAKNKKEFPLHLLPANVSNDILQRSPRKNKRVRRVSILHDDAPIKNSEIQYRDRGAEIEASIILRPSTQTLTLSL